MGISRFFRRRVDAEPVRGLYETIVKQARDPGFYRDWGVPDSLDGRFELISLHAFLVMNRLQQDGAPGAERSQQLYDLMFADMDQSLREMGAGDLGVGKRVKRMAEGFGGRIQAYDAGLEADPGVLEEALARNLYGTLDGPPAAAALAAVADYARREAAALKAQDSAHLMAGQVSFGAVPVPAEMR